MSIIFDWVQYRRYSLDYYIDKLKNKEYFSMVTYGDGEWLSIIRSRWAIRKFKEIRPHHLLRSTLFNNLNDKSFIYATSLETIQKWFEDFHIRSLRSFFKINRRAFKLIHWHDGRVFLYEFINGKLFPFIQQLRKMNVVIIGHKKLKQLYKTVIPYDYFIETKQTVQRGYHQQDYIQGAILNYNKPAVYLFACGHAAPCVIQKLHNKIKDSFLIDIGKGFDYFCEGHGMEMKGLLKVPVAKELILKNLSPIEEEK